MISSRDASATRKHLGVCLATLFLALFILFGVSVASALAGKAELLFINSYHHGFEWSDGLVSSFADKLRRDNIDFELTVEYMDTKRKAGQRSLEPFRDLLAHKYQGRLLDAVVVSDDNAYQFALKYRLELFPETPILFVGVNNFAREQLVGHRQMVSGIIQKTDIYETALTALQQNPEADHIVFVHDGSPTGIGDEREFLRQLPRLQQQFPDVKVDYLTGKDHTTEAMLKRVAELTDRSVVVLSIWTSGSDGKMLPYLDSFSHISAAASVPVYSPAGPAMTYGIVGGKVTTATPHGEAVAEMVERVLGGSSVADIGIVMDSVNLYQFDYMQLKRWGINPDLLPEDALVVNKPVGLFEHYSHILIPLLAFLVVQTCLIILLAVNVRRRKKAEQSALKLNQDLQVKEERLQLALAGANDGIWDWDLAAESMNFDPLYYRMIGYEPYEFPESVEEWKKRVHPEDLPVILEQVARSVDDDAFPYDSKFRFRTKTGGYIWVRGRGKVVVRDDSGKALRFVGTHSDISQLKRAENDLRNLRNYLTSIIDSMPSLLICVDSALTVTYCNLQVRNVAGRDAVDIVGRKLTEALPWLDFVTSPAQLAMHSGREEQLLQHQRIHEGDVVFENISVYPLQGDNSQGAVIRVDDVSDACRKEERATHGRKMEAMGALAGGVAHDFNNMLGGIIGAAELLDIGLASDDRSKKLVRTILKASNRASDLTRKLLSFSGNTPAGSSVVDVQDIIKETEALLRNAINKQVNIILKLEASRSSIVGDPSQLQNVFLNLAINASHAMPEGGDFKIQTREVELDKLYCDNSSFDIDPGSYLEVTVEDNGCGMPPDVMKRIFEPFYSTKPAAKGTGLGLASVYGAVQQCRGAVQVYSEEGKGTRFTLLLPMSSQGQQPPLEQSGLQRGSGKILVVDDEAMMRATATAILEELGYATESAENGAEAVELYKKDPSGYALILLDMVMPVMNGRECFEQIRLINPEARVVLSSGFSREDDVKHMIQQGLKGVIRKPYRSPQLSKLIYKVINED